MKLAVSTKNVAAILGSIPVGLAALLSLIPFLSSPTMLLADTGPECHFLVIRQRSMALFFGDSPQSLPDFRYATYFDWNSESVALIRTEGPPSGVRIGIVNIEGQQGDVTVQMHESPQCAVGFSLPGIEGFRRSLDDEIAMKEIEDLSSRLRLGGRRYQSTHLIWRAGVPDEAMPSSVRSISDSMVMAHWNDFLAVNREKLHEESIFSPGWAINDDVPRNLSAVENKSHVAFTFLVEVEEETAWCMVLVPIRDQDAEIRWFDGMLTEAISGRGSRVFRLVSLSADSRFALLLVDYAYPDMIAAFSDPASLWMMDFEAGTVSLLESSWWTGSRVNRILPATDAVIHILDASGIEYEALKIPPRMREGLQSRAGEASSRLQAN